MVGVERVYERSRQIGLVNAPSPATSHTANRAHVHPACSWGVSTSQVYRDRQILASIAGQ